MQVDHTLYSPTDLGLDLQAVENLRGRIQHAIDKGPLPSIQMALAKDGRLCLFETFGAEDNGTRYHIYSCTKPVVASGVWKLMGEGALDIEQPVSHYLPAFVGGGKEAVTTAQLLCHTAGFPGATMDDPHWWTSATRLAHMAAWQLEWEPGSRVVYHPLSAHWVVAELISVVSGLDYRDYLHQRILDPLGLPGLRVSVAPDAGDDIAFLRHVGEPPADDELRSLFGASVNWPDTQDDSLLIFNDPKVRELGIPGGGAVGTAADVALFYQGVMNNSAGIWSDEVLASAVGEVREAMPDPITGAPANRGMGDKVSPRAFGHQGVGGQVAWGDPATGLSFCLLTNGLDANPIRSARLCAAASNRAGACVTPPPSVQPSAL